MNLNNLTKYVCTYFLAFCDSNKHNSSPFCDVKSRTLSPLLKASNQEIAKIYHELFGKLKRHMLYTRD